MKYMYIIEKSLNHNLKETAEYASDDLAIENLIKLPGRRKLGIKFRQEFIFLFEIDEDESPVLIELESDNIRAECSLHKIREKLMIKLMEKYENIYREKAEQFVRKIPQVNDLKINYRKELLKKMQICKKVFVNCNLAGYDFRELYDLSGAMFINCDLTGANMSGCNLDSAIFTGCILKKILWHNANLTDAVCFDGEFLKLQEKKEVKEGMFNVKSFI